MDHEKIFFPWIKKIKKKILKSFPVVNEKTLQLLLNCIHKEVKILDWNDLNRTEVLYETLNSFYLHFSWKINWNEESHLQQSCAQLLYYMTYVGIILSKGNTHSKWLDKILSALNYSSGNCNIICDVLLLIRNISSKYMPAYREILKSILMGTIILEPVNAECFIKIMLLFRRFKFLITSDDNDKKIDVYSLASKVNRPVDTVIVLSSVSKGCSFKEENIVQKFLKKNLKSTFITNLFTLLFKNKYDEKIINFSAKIKNKSKTASNASLNTQEVYSDVKNNIKFKKRQNAAKEEKHKMQDMKKFKKEQEVCSEKVQFMYDHKAVEIPMSSSIQIRKKLKVTHNIHSQDDGYFLDQSKKTMKCKKAPSKKLKPKEKTSVNSNLFADDLGNNLCLSQKNKNGKITHVLTDEMESSDSKYDNNRDIYVCEHCQAIKIPLKDSVTQKKDDDKLDREKEDFCSANSLLLNKNVNNHIPDTVAFKSGELCEVSEYDNNSSLFHDFCDSGISNSLIQSGNEVNQIVNQNITHTENNIQVQDSSLNMSQENLTNKIDNDMNCETFLKHITIDNCKPDKFQQITPFEIDVHQNVLKKAMNLQSSNNNTNNNNLRKNYVSTMPDDSCLSSLMLAEENKLDHIGKNSPHSIKKQNFNNFDKDFKLCYEENAYVTPTKLVMQKTNRSSKSPLSGCQLNDSPESLDLNVSKSSNQFSLERSRSIYTSDSCTSLSDDLSNFQEMISPKKVKRKKSCKMQDLSRESVPHFNHNSKGKENTLNETRNPNVIDIDETRLKHSATAVNLEFGLFSEEVQSCKSMHEDPSEVQSFVKDKKYEMLQNHRKISPRSKVCSLYKEDLINQNDGQNQCKDIASSLFKETNNKTYNRTQQECEKYLSESSSDSDFELKDSINKAIKSVNNSINGNEKTNISLSEKFLAKNTKQCGSENEFLPRLFPHLSSLTNSDFDKSFDLKKQDKVDEILLTDNSQLNCNQPVKNSAESETQELKNLDLTVEHTSELSSDSCYELKESIHISEENKYNSDSSDELNVPFESPLDSLTESQSQIIHLSETNTEIVNSLNLLSNNYTNSTNQKEECKNVQKSVDNCINNQDHFSNPSTEKYNTNSEKKKFRQQLIFEFLSKPNQVTLSNNKKCSSKNPKSANSINFEIAKDFSDLSMKSQLNILHTKAKCIDSSESFSHVSEINVSPKFNECTSVNKQEKLKYPQNESPNLIDKENMNTDKLQNLKDFSGSNSDLLCERTLDNLNQITENDISSSLKTIKNDTVEIVDKRNISKLRKSLNDDIFIMQQVLQETTQENLSNFDEEKNKDNENTCPKFNFEKSDAYPDNLKSLETSNNVYNSLSKNNSVVIKEASVVLQDCQTFKNFPHIQDCTMASKNETGLLVELDSNASALSSSVNSMPKSVYQTQNKNINDLQLSIKSKSPEKSNHLNDISKFVNSNEMKEMPHEFNISSQFDNTILSKEMSNSEKNVNDNLYRSNLSESPMHDSYSKDESNNSVDSLHSITSKSNSSGSSEEHDIESNNRSLNNSYSDDPKSFIIFSAEESDGDSVDASSDLDDFIVSDNYLSEDNSEQSLNDSACSTISNRSLKNSSKGIFSKKQKKRVILSDSENEPFDDSNFSVTTQKTILLPTNTKENKMFSKSDIDAFCDSNSINKTKISDIKRHKSKNSSRNKASKFKKSVYNENSFDNSKKLSTQNQKSKNCKTNKISLTSDLSISNDQSHLNNINLKSSTSKNLLNSSSAKDGFNTHVEDNARNSSSDSLPLSQNSYFLRKRKSCNFKNVTTRLQHRIISSNNQHMQVSSHIDGDDNDCTPKIPEINEESTMLCENQYAFDKNIKIPNKTCHYTNSSFELSKISTSEVKSSNISVEKAKMVFIDNKDNSASTSNSKNVTKKTRPIQRNHVQDFSLLSPGKSLKKLSNAKNKNFECFDQEEDISDSFECIPPTQVQKADFGSCDLSEYVLPTQMQQNSPKNSSQLALNDFENFDNYQKESKLVTTVNLSECKKIQFGLNSMNVDISVKKNTNIEPSESILLSNIQKDVPKAFEICTVKSKQDSCNINQPSLKHCVNSNKIKSNSQRNDSSKLFKNQSLLESTKENIDLSHNRNPGSSDVLLQNESLNNDLLFSNKKDTNNSMKSLSQEFLDNSNDLLLCSVVDKLQNDSINTDTLISENFLKDKLTDNIIGSSFKPDIVNDIVFSNQHINSSDKCNDANTLSLKTNNLSKNLSENIVNKTNHCFSNATSTVCNSYLLQSIPKISCNTITIDKSYSANTNCSNSVLQADSLNLDISNDINSLANTNCNISISQTKSLNFDPCIELIHCDKSKKFEKNEFHDDSSSNLSLGQQLNQMGFKMVPESKKCLTENYISGVNETQSTKCSSAAVAKILPKQPNVRKASEKILLLFDVEKNSYEVCQLPDTPICDILNKPSITHSESQTDINDTNSNPVIKNENITKKIDDCISEKFITVNGMKFSTASLLPVVNLGRKCDDVELNSSNAEKSSVNYSKNCQKNKQITKRSLRSKKK